MRYRQLIALATFVLTTVGNVAEITAQPAVSSQVGAPNAELPLPRSEKETIPHSSLTASSTPNDGGSGAKDSTANPPSDLRVGERLDMLGRVIALQQSNDNNVANILQVLVLCVLLVSAATAISVVGLVRWARSYLLFWATNHLSNEFRQISRMALEFNAKFVSAVEEFSASQTQAKIADIEDKLDRDQEVDPNWLLLAVRSLVLQPTILKDDIQAIVYRSDEPEARQMHRLRAIWSEVKTGSVSCETAETLVAAMLQLMEQRGDRLRTVKALRKFHKQLREKLSQNSPLPAEPDF